MERNKILLVANTDWYLQNFRTSLGKFLQNQGFEVVFVSPNGEFVQEIEKNGFNHIIWNVGRRSMGLTSELKSIWKLIKIYKQEKPLLVHHFTIKPVLYGSLAAKLSKINAIVNSITGLGYIFLNESWRGKLLRTFLFPIYKFALNNKKSHTIFENQGDREIFLENHFVTSTLTSIIQGVGVDEEYFYPSHEPLNDIPLIIFPARLLYDKGVETLVDASRILKDKTKVKIALVGDLDPGNPSMIDKSVIQKWEKEGLIEWWGFQSDMLRIYQSCNLVTLPSLGEGLPTVLIEAASCGRAIVATDVAGCRDVVLDGVNGILVPPKDPNALANAILFLINDAKKREKMGQEGRKIVLEKFTSKKVNEETLKVYQTLI